MFAVFKRAAASAAEAHAQEPPAIAPDLHRIVDGVSRQASTRGREAAEVRGVIDDTHKSAGRQAEAVQSLARQLRDVTNAQGAIAEETAASRAAVEGAGTAVQAIGGEVAGIVETLRQVSTAAGQITQIALQTRLVAFNASVEAKRAGEAGRGFGVVADAVKDLAAKVETSSKEIMSTVASLDARIAALAREIRRDAAGATDVAAGAVHRALDASLAAVRRIDEAATRSRELCEAAAGQIGAIEGEMRQTSRALEAALVRTDTFLEISERMIETVAECGVVTEDTPYIRAAQEAAGQVAKLLEDALRTGTIGEAALFDERYRPVPGSAPQQHLAGFVELAERLFPQVQERMLSLSDKVVFCIAVDRNGYIPCHNRRYNHAQRPGDLAWNTANSRGRRIFADRTGLASARNQRPFLLQTYRRDMGGGQFVVMKEAAAPISVAGRHWGGVRLAFRF
jgi:methyl-accepting chemotaxis protein